MTQRKAYSLGMSANKTPAPAPGPAYNKPVKQQVKGGRTAWVATPKNPNSNLPVLKRPINPVPYATVQKPNPWVELGNQVQKRLPPAAQVAVELYKTMPVEYRDQALRVFTGLKDRINILPDGSGSSGSSDSNVMNSSYGLSKAPNPKPVYLNSGIVPNTYSNDYMAPKVDMCSPMHMSMVSLQIPTDSLQSLYGYFLNTVAFDIQTRAQANVGFSLDITSTLTSANLLTAMNAGIKALQVYYYYASILSYESDPRNKNTAMIKLRSLCSPQLISDLTQLGRRLEDTPMPPRVVQWIRYMNMNFLSGDTQGSPILKLGLGSSYVLSTNDSSTYPAQALATLTASNTIFALIRRAIPQWRIGTLYDVPITPVYDKNFLTIFANAPWNYKNTTPTYFYGPSVSTDTQTINYNSYNNKLDGAAYAMCSAYKGSLWYPGIMQAVLTDPYSNRMSFYNNGSTDTWLNSSDYTFLSRSRQESYAIRDVNTGAPYTLHLSGADMCQGVSISSMTQTGQNFLDFIFNVGRIPVKGKLSNFNNNGSGNV